MERKQDEEGEGEKTQSGNSGKREADPWQRDEINLDGARRGKRAKEAKPWRKETETMRLWNALHDTPHSRKLKETVKFEEKSFKNAKYEVFIFS